MITVSLIFLNAYDVVNKDGCRNIEIKYATDKMKGALFCAAINLKKGIYGKCRRFDGRCRFRTVGR
jgi:hypothetical protein